MANSNAQTFAKAPQSAHDRHIRDHVREGPAILYLTIKCQEHGPYRVHCFGIRHNHLADRLSLWLDLVPDTEYVKHTGCSRNNRRGAHIFLPDILRGSFNNLNLHMWSGLFDGNSNGKSDISAPGNHHIQHNQTPAFLRISPRHYRPWKSIFLQQEQS
ncbi:hypothetical protein D3C80_1534080 [compost metagenome]